MTVETEAELLAEALQRESAERVFTRTFVLLVLAQVAQSVGANLVFTSIPLVAVTYLGLGTQIVGLVIGLQYLVSFLARLPIGHLIDQRAASGRGAVPQIVVGGAGLVLGSLLYMLAGLADLPILLVAAAVAAGAGSASFTTATNTELAYSIPIGRRAEAMGYFGIAQTIGTGLGAGSSFFLFTSFGLPAPFAAGAALYVVGIVLGARAQARHSIADRMPSGRLALELSVLPPALAVWGLVIGQGSGTAFVQLLGIERGVSNPGVYYYAHAVAAVALRIFGGRLADRYGRLTVIVPSLVSHSAGLVLLSQARSTEAMAIAGLAVGIGFAGALSTLQALTVDLAGPRKRGSALAMFWGATDVGVISGVFLGGQLAAAYGYSGLFLITSLGPAAGAIGLALWGARRQA